MRGTRRNQRPSTADAGIIPAYAGNTPGLAIPEDNNEDHPRVCGEHRCPSIATAHERGSSPRMRGTHVQSVERHYGRGIIPAYAGNTSSIRSSNFSVRDHPRVCGEHLWCRTEKLHNGGSSPRMRGTPAIRIPAHSRTGIIPAYAGNTSNTRLRARPHRDHPRVCGEHSDLAIITE